MLRRKVVFLLFDIVLAVTLYLHITLSFDPMPVESNKYGQLVSCTAVLHLTSD